MARVRGAGRSLDRPRDRARRAGARVWSAPLVSGSAPGWDVESDPQRHHPPGHVGRGGQNAHDGLKRREADHDSGRVDGGGRWPLIHPSGGP